METGVEGLFLDATHKAGDPRGPAWAEGDIVLNECYDNFRSLRVQNADYWDGAGNAWQGKIEASLDGGSTWSYMLCITGDDAHVKMLPASRATELCARVRAMV